MRAQVRGFIEDMLEAELDAALSRKRYERARLAALKAKPWGRHPRAGLDRRCARRFPGKARRDEETPPPDFMDAVYAVRRSASAGEI